MRGRGTQDLSLNPKAYPMTDFTQELTERLVRYCAIDSQSDMDSPSAPSTDCQHDLLDLDAGVVLVAELLQPPLDLEREVGIVGCGLTGGAPLAAADRAVEPVAVR